jgi:hypothetical protein
MVAQVELEIVVQPVLEDWKLMKDSGTPVSQALQQVVTSWRQQGEPQQQASAWFRSSWATVFPEYKARLELLPERIDRAETARIVGKATTAGDAEWAFITAMIWGYGRVGYGAYRTARVLRSSENVAKRLADVASIAQEQGGLEAFANLATSPLKYLGVAFGTKYLYFCTRAADAQEPAPVLDRVVRDWLVEHADIKLDISSWRSDHYRRYVDLLRGWSAQLDLPIDTVEELIFRSAIRREGSPSSWAESWLVDPKLGADETDSGAGRDALEALAELQQALAELPVDSSSADEAQSHIRSLGEIIKRTIAR